MKKIISTLLSLVLVIGMLPIMASADEVTPAWDGTAAESFAGGAGTKSDPWQIETAAQLKLASDKVNAKNGAKYFILMNDIDYENQQWVPMGHCNSGNSAPWFSGEFNGNNHVVRNLKIDYSYDDYATVSGLPVYTYCGFFGLVIDAKITNLGIENLQITVKNPGGTTNGISSGNYRAAYIGGFAGALRGSTTVSGCYIKNSSVRQIERWNGETNGIGGFVGFVQPTAGSFNVSDCYVYNVEYCSAVQRVAAGFVAHFTQSGGNFTNCYVADYTANYSTDASTPSTTYGFGCTGKDSNKPESAVNCYSTLTSGKGTHSSPATYSTAREIGVAGASLSTIDTIFTNLANWQDGKYINNGFPALAWEKVPIEVKDFADGAVTLEVNKAIDGAKVYVAAYDGTTGRLISADVADVATTVPVNVTTTGATIVKVFVWDANLNPVAASFSKPL